MSERDDAGIGTVGEDDDGETGVGVTLDDGRKSNAAAGVVDTTVALVFTDSPPESVANSSRSHGIRTRGKSLSE